MDGIVSTQGQQQQHQQQQRPHQQQQLQRQQAAPPQQQKRKEWRVVSSSERLFPAAPRMSLAVRQRDASRHHPQRNERAYADSNPSGSSSGKDAEEVTLAQHQAAADRSEHPPVDGHVDDPDEALQHRINEISRQREHLQQVELELRARFFARSEILRLQNSFEEQAKQHNEIVSNLQEQLHDRDEQMQQLRQHLQDREQKLQMEANEALNQVWTKDALLREQSNEVANLRRECESAIAEHKAEKSQFGAERADLLAQVTGLKEQIHEKDRRLQEMEEQGIFFSNDKQLRDAQMWMARAQELEAYHVNTMNAEYRDRNEQMTQMWVACQRQVADVERYYSQVIQKLQQDYAESNHFVRNTTMRGSKVSEPAVHLKPGVMPLGDSLGAVPLMVPPEGVVLTPPMLGVSSVIPPSGTASIQQYGNGPPLSQQQFSQPSQVQPFAAVIISQHSQQQQLQQEKQLTESPQVGHAGLKAEQVSKPPELAEQVDSKKETKSSEVKSSIQKEKPGYDISSVPEERIHEELARPSEASDYNPSSNAAHQQPYVCDGNNGKSHEPQLLDGDSLLACLIRVIPVEPSAKIRISSTLPNRLAKILAPLHWHDYRKHYGRLDEFVEAHPQLFVVEGDFIHLREGAHAIVSASTAQAKATAAAMMPSGAIQTPTVALTPVAQPQTQRSKTASLKAAAAAAAAAAPGPAAATSAAAASMSKDSKRLAENGASNGSGTPAYAAKSLSFNSEAKQQQRMSNGFDGYIDGYFKNMRNHDLGARPQTQEGRIMEAAAALAQ